VDIENKMCFDFLYNFCPKRFLFWEELSEILSKIYIGLRLEYLFFLSDFNETGLFWIDFRKTSKF
jgi:hypothetical protein